LKPQGSGKGGKSAAASLSASRCDLEWLWANLHSMLAAASLRSAAAIIGCRFEHGSAVAVPRALAADWCGTLCSQATGLPQKMLRSLRGKSYAELQTKGLRSLTQARQVEDLIKFWVAALGFNFLDASASIACFIESPSSGRMLWHGRSHSRLNPLVATGFPVASSRYVLRIRISLAFAACGLCSSLGFRV
jgi:hypothetical protein